MFVHHLKNPENRSGIIEKLYFDLHVAFGESVGSRARVRVFSVGTNGLPDQDLLITEVIKRIDRLTPNLQLDVAKYRLILPPEGVFIGLEFFCTFDTKPRKDPTRYVIKTNCPHLPTARVADYDANGCSFFWTEFKGKMKWLNYSDGTFYPGTRGHVFKFGAKVAY